MYYRAVFGRSRWNGAGINRRPNNFGAIKRRPLGWDRGRHPRNTVLPTWPTVPNLVTVSPSASVYVWRFAKMPPPICPDFKGHSTSLELTRIDRSLMTSYQCSIVTLDLPCTVSKIQQGIGRRLRFFPTDVTMSISGHRLGDSTWNF